MTNTDELRLPFSILGKGPGVGVFDQALGAIYNAAHKPDYSNELEWIPAGGLSAFILLFSDAAGFVNFFCLIKKQSIG